MSGKMKIADKMARTITIWNCMLGPKNSKIASRNTIKSLTQNEIMREQQQQLF